MKGLSILLLICLFPAFAAALDSEATLDAGNLEQYLIAVRDSLPDLKAFKGDKLPDGKFSLKFKPGFVRVATYDENEPHSGVVIRMTLADYLPNADADDYFKAFADAVSDTTVLADPAWTAEDGPTTKNYQSKSWVNETTRSRLTMICTKSTGKAPAGDISLYITPVYRN